MYQFPSHSNKAPKEFICLELKKKGYNVEEFEMFSGGFKGKGYPREIANDFIRTKDREQ